MSKKLIKRMTLALTLMLTTLCFSPSVQASTETTTPIIFICHKGLNYTKGQVKFAYMGYMDEPRPVDNRLLFNSLLDFINYSQSKYRHYWIKNYFRIARFVPKMMQNDQEVIQWVAAVDSGVGYVSTAPKNNPNVEVCGDS